MNEPIIKCTGLSKNYGYFQALSGVSFIINQPNIIGILGKNGAGKTTLIKMLAGLLPPSQGELTFGKRKYSNQDISIKMEIGLLLNEPMLYQNLSIRENINFFERMNQNFNQKQITQSIEELASLVNLNDWIDEPISVLSTGMQRKADLIRLFSKNTKILLLDEPFAGLDVKSVKNLLEFIKVIHQKKQQIIIFSTHNVDLAKKICDRVVILKKGKISGDLPKEKIKISDIELYF